ncbi:hypothetical protein LTR27_012059 [Elasticomyces elasticus]|nr:hypothetical protein LTR27_012059 [Elasticomyces elasticus]
MPARKASTANRPIVQESGLLDLPPEMRNAIYEYIVSGNITVSYKNSKLLYTPTLSRVCQQLRKEYEGIYRHHAPPLAKAVNINTADLDEREPSETAQLSCIEDDSRLRSLQGSTDRSPPGDATDAGHTHDYWISTSWEHKYKYRLLLSDTPP